MYMIDKKIFFTLLTSTTISGFIVICTAAQSLRSVKTRAKAPPIVEEVELTPYVLKKYNNTLGVFRGDYESPYKVLDCDFSLLAEADIEALTKGIAVETEAELNSLIEDFTS